MLSELDRKGMLSSQGIGSKGLLEFIDKKTDLVGKDIIILRSYNELFEQNDTGRRKLTGPFLGHSIDFDGTLYLRKNASENYLRVGSI